MMNAYGFIDGGYLSKVAEKLEITDPNPKVVSEAVGSRTVQSLAPLSRYDNNVRLRRVTYYDAVDLEGNRPEREDYWKRVELLPDMQLGFGFLKGAKRRVRQKGVDTLIAVDMVAGSYSRIFGVAIVLAGDADFVPVFEEVRRQGVSIVLIAEESSLSSDLRRATDRFIPIVSSTAKPSDGDHVSLRTIA